MLIRLYVSLWSWLNEIRSAELDAGKSPTGQLTRLSRRYPFQLALGAISILSPRGARALRD